MESGELKKNKSKKEDLFFDLTNELPTQETQQMKPTSLETEICGICLDKISSEAKLDSCIHKFCYECIQKWSETANVCPMCTTKFHRLTKTQVRDKNNSYFSHAFSRSLRIEKEGKESRSG